MMGRCAYSQQNLFNVPSATITDQHEVFFQEQLNLGAFGESNLTIDYGLGNNWEVGLNVFKVNLYPGVVAPRPGEANNDAVLVNLQKVFAIQDNLLIELGMQNGLSANNSQQQVDVLNFSWLVTRYTAPEPRWGSYLIGVYHGTDSYLGRGNNMGYMLGTEIPLVGDDLSFVGDYISGDNGSSVAVLGLQWTVSRKHGWQISFGGQLPSPGSGNGYGAVFELTKYPPTFGRSPKAEIATNRWLRP